MDWKTLCWGCTLDEPPVVEQLSIYRRDYRPGTVESYSVKVWSLHLYRYSGQQTVDGVRAPIRAGYAAVTPPDRTIEYRFDGPATHASAHFHVHAGRKRPTHFLPVMQDLGSEFEAVYAEMEEAVRCSSSQPARARACLWHVLCRLARTGPIPAASTDHRGAGESGNLHPAVLRALELIELRLGDPLRASDVVAHSGVSHNHLNRLFAAALGEPLRRYITRRRMERARYLLVNSTIPVKVIAVGVGIPDPHLFNKTVRKVLGCAPTAIRLSGGHNKADTAHADPPLDRARQ